MSDLSSSNYYHRFGSLMLRTDRTLGLAREDNRALLRRANWATLEHQRIAEVAFGKNLEVHHLQHIIYREFDDDRWNQAAINSIGLPGNI